VLTETRAMVVRDCLVDKFAFNDRPLKTMEVGKQTDVNSDTGWGTVRILIYPAATEIPPAKQTQTGISSKTASE